MTDPVVKTVVVPCSQERAFSIFATDFAKWWPKDKHSVSAMGETAKPAKEVRLDPRTGGDVWEIGPDGTRYEWGSVAVYDPHARLSLNWHIARPKEEATTVDVTFEPVPDGTKVTLTHTGWEVFGENAGSMRENYNGGWVHVFETCFGEACLAEEAA